MADSPQNNTTDPEAILVSAEERARISLTEAVDLATRALDLATEQENDDLVDRSLAVRAQFYTQLNDLEAATADAKRAIAGYEKRDNERGRAGVLNTLSIIKEHLGQYTESFLMLSECLVVLRRLDIPHAIAQVASNLGLTCSYVGDWDQALEFYRESLEAWERVEPQPGKGNVLVNLGFAHTSLQDFDQADEYFHEALKVYGDDDPLHNTVVYTNLARNQLDRGNLEKAAELAEIAHKTSEQQDDPARRAHALEITASVLAAKGKTTAARENYEAALSIYRSIPLPRGCAIVLRQLARLAGDKPEEAGCYLTEAEEMARKTGLKPILIDILGDFHELCRIQDRWEEACFFLEEKVKAEKALLKDYTTIKLKTLQMDLKLKQSQRETELERVRSGELAEAMADLARQKELAEEENRQKSEILNFAAHDLRNLLWGILGPAELIDADREKLQHDPEIIELIDAMHRSAHMLEETLQNVLSAAATESGQVELNRTPTLLREIVREAVGSWRSAAKDKNQTIEIHSENADTRLSIDRGRIRDCLQNLVSNAIKYSPKGSTIRVGITDREKEIDLFVADKGPGLTEEDRQRVGRLFQKLSAKPTGGEISVGVGLAVVKRFTELHGGRLEIDCPPDGGSVFRLVLPKEG